MQQIRLSFYLFLNFILPNVGEYQDGINLIDTFQKKLPSFLCLESYAFFPEKYEMVHFPQHKTRPKLRKKVARTIWLLSFGMLLSILSPVHNLQHFLYTQALDRCLWKRMYCHSIAISNHLKWLQDLKVFKRNDLFNPEHLSKALEMCTVIIKSLAEANRVNYTEIERTEYIWKCRGNYAEACWGKLCQANNREANRAKAETVECRGKLLSISKVRSFRQTVRAVEEYNGILPFFGPVPIYYLAGCRSKRLVPDLL